MKRNFYQSASLFSVNFHVCISYKLYIEIIAMKQTKIKGLMADKIKTDALVLRTVFILYVLLYFFLESVMCQKLTQKIKYGCVMNFTFTHKIY